MSTIDEINQMRQSGMSEQQISAELKKRGLSKKEISDSLSQAEIKEAVTPSPKQLPDIQSEQAGAPTVLGNQAIPATQEMQPSLLQEPPQQNPQPLIDQQNPQPNPDQQESFYTPSETNQDYEQSYPSPGTTNAQYSQYQPYQQTTISPNTMSDISEQIVSEKLFPLKSQVEKILSSQTISETKLESLDSRLQQIEKIIDRLQLSILQKIGDSISDISNLKKELIETQKSFKTISKKTHHRKTTHKRKSHSKK